MQPQLKLETRFFDGQSLFSRDKDFSKMDGNLRSVKTFGVIQSM